MFCVLFLLNKEYNISNLDLGEHKKARVAIFRIFMALQFDEYEIFLYIIEFKQRW